MFVLIRRGDEIRFTPERVTATSVENQKRHGWEVIASWRNKPTSQAVSLASAIAELAR